MSDQHDILTQADLAVYDAEPGTQLTHVGACIRAIARIGGDPATVGELVAALRKYHAAESSWQALQAYNNGIGICMADDPLTEAHAFASAVLAKLPENSNEG